MKMFFNSQMKELFRLESDILIRQKQSFISQHIFQIPDFDNKSTLTKIEISKDGSMAYTMGSYLAIMQGEDGNSVQEPGKWVTIWKKHSDGKWLIIMDTYNTDIPPPDHK